MDSWVDTRNDGDADPCLIAQVEFDGKRQHSILSSLEMKKNSFSLSIFFPFLNDWGTVGSLVSLAIATAEKYTDDWEVIVVNDGSSNKDREALESIIKVILIPMSHREKNPKGDWKTRGDPSSRRNVGTQDDIDGRIRIIHHKKNRGYGGALRSGFAAAKKDFIFYTDCDAQYDPRELTLLIEKMKSFDKTNGKSVVGMVNGYKIKRNDPFHRIVAGRIYHYLVKFAFRLPIRDTDCDFRLIRREVFDPPAGGSGRTAVRLFENTGTICTELVKKIDQAGYKIVEVPVHHFWRTSGKSQFFNFQRLYFTAVNLFRLWWKLIVRREYDR